MRRAAVLVFLVWTFAARAWAWEPGSAADIEKRIAELQAAWKDKDGAAILADKLARARQQGKPAWASKVAWKLQGGGKTYYLGVGASPHLTSAARKLTAAEVRAHVGETAPGATMATALDWYLDESSGTLWALTVQTK